MDGIIIINKPKGCTSHDIVYKIKKKLNTKVGHTGTLDPMATGVLPLLIGKGTQCSKYLINHDKKYIATIQLGKKTDTADSEGNVIEEKEIEENKLETNTIKEILNTFLGKQKQTPPIYSAIKVNGKKLYEYARKGQTVEIKPREIEIYDIELLNIEKEKKQIKIKVSCSKGTYIRSLCEDIAIKLETVRIHV
ncbi:MAG: tRNA pseudouridine(55) synthase TruB [Clostridia bacterium]|nr:tRNA pseudouridine(55) synthase TruB [Clostridia bacterium]